MPLFSKKGHIGWFAHAEYPSLDYHFCQRQINHWTSNGLSGANKYAGSFFVCIPNTSIDEAWAPAFQLFKRERERERERERDSLPLPPGTIEAIMPTETMFLIFVELKSSSLVVQCLSDSKANTQSLIKTHTLRVVKSKSRVFLLFDSRSQK